MTAKPADPVGEAIGGEAAATRTLHAIRCGFALPDRLLEDLQDVIAADGGPSVRSPRGRAFLRRGREALEAGAAFEERVINLHIFQVLFYALFERYMKEVRDSAKFAVLQKRAKQWVKDRAGK